MRCLVTTLDAVVPNNNLPILEEFHEFTADAIALSGNSAILSNETQKWALNSFFEKVGAIDNNATWAKIEALYLPIICNKNANTALTNYVNNVVMAISGTSSFSANGGLITDNDQHSNETYSGNNTELSLITLSPDPDFATFKTTTGNLNCIGVRDSSTGAFMQWHWVSSSQQNRVLFLGGTIVLYDMPYGIACVYNSTSQKIDGIVHNGGITEVESLSTVTTASISSKTFLLNGHASFPVGIGVIAKGLTKIEARTILEAGYELMEAFMS